MTLLSSLTMANGSLNASSLGIQVAGQNLNNANTPSYVRETLNLASASTYKSYGGVAIGGGVSITSVTQVLDKFLEERLRNSASDVANTSVQSQYYTQLEATLNELTSSDLSTLLTSFFNSISNVQNQPENLILRQMVGEAGLQVTDWLNQTSSTLVSMELDINKRVESTCDQINLLLTQIQQLNANIAKVEAGHTASEAVGLRDQRLSALSELSKLVNIRTAEDPKTGMISVTCGSSILLSGTVRQEVSLVYETTAAKAEAAFLQVGDRRLDVSGGAVYGLYEARDTVIAGTLSALDTFASQIITEFNKIHTGGQGLTGYTNLTSQSAVAEPENPLSTQGLVPKIVNGQFRFLVTNSEGITTEHVVNVRVYDAPPSDPFSLKGSPPVEGTSLADIAAALNAIDGVVAKIDSRNRLVIESESPDLQFSFAGDTSNVLSAMGINTFFTGRDAGTISISETILRDPSKVAASLSGPGQDTDIATRLAAMPETKLASLGNRSITDAYKTINSAVSIAGGTTKALLAANVAHNVSLSAQRDAISGVNIDEETIMLLTYQRSYQATAKYISIINEMLESLINM